jgi:hypothetical protein
MPTYCVMHMYISIRIVNFLVVWYNRRRLPCMTEICRETNIT